MKAPVKHVVNGEEIWLSADKCFYWDKEKALVLADLHLGKSGHFRKEGVGIPQTVFKEDLHCLLAQVQFFRPEQLIVVGDMFHSRANKELDLFSRWRNDFSALHIQLVKGNHDILKEDWYFQNGIQVHDECLVSGRFLFQHDYDPDCKEVSEDAYLFCGHIHPGISLRGLGRQRLQFPCFYFAERFCALPAFSRFTGFSLVKKQKKDRVFAIVNNDIVGF